MLTAFQNVADTSGGAGAGCRGPEGSRQRRSRRQATLDLTQRQSQDGYANDLALLSAEQAYQQARITIVQAQASRYADTAALFQALGGGWWHRADLEGRSECEINLALAGASILSTAVVGGLLAQKG